MAIHYFICDVCELSITDTSTKGVHKCPECGEDMRWDLGKIQVGGDVTYGRTKYSDAMAVSPSQIEEHKKLFPDIKVDEHGRPGFDSFRQHDNYLKKCGFVKHPQKIKSRLGKKRIA